MKGENDLLAILFLMIFLLSYYASPPSLLGFFVFCFSSRLIWNLFIIIKKVNQNLKASHYFGEFRETPPEEGSKGGFLK